MHNRDRKSSVDGPESEIYGWAGQDDPKQPAELTVHLDGVPVGAPYWVVALGEVKDKQYQWAVVSDGLQVSLFVLARNVTEFNSKYDETVRATLKALGFTEAWNSPIPTVQQNCTYWPPAEVTA